MKICTKCKEEKKESEFYKNSRGTNLRSCCIKCHLEQGKRNQANYYKKNRDRKLESRRQWGIRNKEHRKEYDNNRRKNDPKLRIRKNISRAVSFFITKNNGNKNRSSILNHLPYKIEELKIHLEKQFESWMNWDNYGPSNRERRTWQIDHIIPQNELQYDSMSHPNFLKSWALENLRPLESIKNILKSDNIEKIPLSRNALDKEDINSLICWLQTNPTPKFSQGSFVEVLEKMWSSKLGVKYSIFVNSGSSANLLAIYSLVIKNNIRKVVVPALSWSTTVSPIIQFGLEPILCEVERDTLSIDPQKFEEICQQEKPDALFLVHVLGIPGKINEILKICEKYNIILLEDSCEAMESLYDGKKVGTFGLMSTFSLFYAHIICSCEGGFVSTNDEELYNILIALRSHGWSQNWSVETKLKYEEKYGVNPFDSKYTFYYPSFNVRNNEINAHLGMSQLLKLDKFCEKRKTLLHLYDNLIQNDYWKLKINEGCVGFAYPIIHPNRNVLIQKLRDNNIEVRPLIAGNIGLQPFWVDRYGKKNFEFADIVHDFGCYIPIHHNISNVEIDFVCKIVNQAIK